MWSIDVEAPEVDDVAVIACDEVGSKGAEVELGTDLVELAGVVDSDQAVELSQGPRDVEICGHVFVGEYELDVNVRAPDETGTEPSQSCHPGALDISAGEVG